LHASITTISTIIAINIISNITKKEKGKRSEQAEKRSVQSDWRGQSERRGRGEARKPVP